MTIAAFLLLKQEWFGLVKAWPAPGSICVQGCGWCLSFRPAGYAVEVLDVVAPFASGYGVELAMTIKAARCGFRILEVPTTMFHRVTGRIFRFMHRGKQFKDVLLALISSWKEVCSMKILIGGGVVIY